MKAKNKRRLTLHSKVRIRERTNLNHQQRRNIFKQALTYGKSIGDLEEGPVKDFLNKKANSCKVKLYQNYVFIYSKNSHRLYTMYKLPDELLNKSEVN